MFLFFSSVIISPKSNSPFLVPDDVIAWYTYFFKYQIKESEYQLYKKVAYEKRNNEQKP